MSIRRRIAMYRFRRLPMFPFFPIVPMALVVLQGLAMARVYRRIARLEARL
ncbi:MAG TPA: hypothetical protein VE987_08090 [Polyangiaceae bacterium]|nr:hypothetical protein [Polyangiaceae bacterium]